MEQLKMSLMVNVSKQGSRFVASSPALDIRCDDVPRLHAHLSIGKVFNATE